MGELAENVAPVGAVGELGSAHPVDNTAAHSPATIYPSLIASSPPARRPESVRAILSGKPLVAHGGNVEIF